MSIYEGIGSITENIIVVIDIGSAYTKFGFAGEFSPRCIIPSEVTLQTTGEVRKLADYTNSQDLYDMLVDFLYVLYMKYGLISPKDRTTVVVESMLCPTTFRETLAKVLFHHFEVRSAVWLPSHLVCLSTLAVDTALVLDIGYKEAVVIPVFHGIPVLKAWQALPLASQAIHNNIKTTLKSEKPDIELSEQNLEDIKVRTCFVTNMERSQLYATNQPPLPCPNVEYLIGGHQSLQVSGKLRETAFEILFQLQDFQSLTTMILDSILQCPMDMRKQLAENILIIGGTAMIPGFKARLREELMHMLGSKTYDNRLFLKSFKFHTAPSKENYTAWLGGAIYGSTDVISIRCLSKENYIKLKRVPDWSNLLDQIAQL